MEFSVTPVSEASFSPPPPPPPPPPLSPPPPHAARVEATVAAARTRTSRRDDLDNCSPLVRPGLRCPGVWMVIGSPTGRPVVRVPSPPARGAGRSRALGAGGQPAQAHGA